MLAREVCADRSLSQEGRGGQRPCPQRWHGQITPKRVLPTLPPNQRQDSFQGGTLVSLEWLNSRKRLSKNSKYQGTRMWPPSEAGILEVKEPAVPQPPGPYQPLLGGGAPGKPGLGAAVPGVRGALRPESQVRAHPLQLPPSSRTSQMDSSSVP